MVSFVVTLVNTENSGLTEEELETIEQQTLIAANLWGRHFDAPGVVIEIEVDVASDRTAAGSQSSVFIETLESGANVFQTGVAYELATGIDPNGDQPDIRVQLREEDVAQTFFLETEPDTRTGDIPLGQQDFISIMLHELGHGFGFGGFVGGGPISEVFDATTLGVFDTFFEEVEGGFVFNGENVLRVAGRPLELNEELSRGFLSHFGNLPATFQGFSAYPGFGDDLGAMVMAGFFFLRDVRYYITAADIAVLEDVGVPIRRPSESNDLLYGYEMPDPGVEANYGVPNASFLSGNDSIDALDGDDTIYGFSGADTLKGGGGADLLEGGAGADLLNGGAGIDTASYADSTEAVQVDLAVGSVAGGDAVGDEYVSIEGVQGSAFADALTGDSATNSLLGLAGNDTLSGGRGADTLDGGEGDDVLFGGTQADRLDGGAGNDSLLGGNGNDTVEGGSGNDTLSGSIGDDSLNGGSQGDRLFGDAGADTLNGGGGSDRVDYLIGDDPILVDLETGEATGGFADGDVLVSIESLFGGKGDDTLRALEAGSRLNGAGGDDVVTGRSGNDLLAGGNGNDVVTGGAGADLMNGNRGDDTLDGGAGDDTLRGSAGSDTFIFSDGTGDDIVLDFRANDLLDLSATSTDFTSLADVQSAATETEAGLLIDLGGGDSVLLANATLASLADDNLLL